METGAETADTFRINGTSLRVRGVGGIWMTNLKNRYNECPDCGEKLLFKKETVEHGGEILGEFEFEECKKCGIKFYFNDLLIAIEKLETRKAVPKK